MGVGTTNGPGKIGWYAKQAYDDVREVIDAIDGQTALKPATPSQDGYMTKEYAERLEGIVSPTLSRNTSYAVGDIALIQLSPTECKKLVCVQAGTTASGNLTLASTEEGSITTDGTVVWAIDSYAVSGETLVYRNTIDRGAQIPWSWADLKAKIQAGNFEDIYIGDYKGITLTTGEQVVMEVAGIDTYYNTASTPIGHHIDFISRDCLAGFKAMNSTDTNNGKADEKHPWRASDLYQVLNNESTGVYATLPSDLKNHIIGKFTHLEERYSAAGAVATNTGWSWTNAGRLWLPNEIETFGFSTWCDMNYGTNQGIQYPLFKLGGYKHIMKSAGKDGPRSTWWEASASRANATHFCTAYGHGHANHNVASLPGVCAPLCFRIG